MAQDKESGKSRQQKKAEAQKERAKKAVYSCTICEAMFDEPGMCPNCNVVLKKKAE